MMITAMTAAAQIIQNYWKKCNHDYMPFAGSKLDRGSTTILQEACINQAYFSSNKCNSGQLGMTTLNFYQTPANNVNLEEHQVCYTSAPVGNPEIDRVLGLLKQARSNNTTGLFMCALVAFLAFLVVWYSVQSIMASIANWRSHYFYNAANSFNLNPDDTNYIDDNGDDDLPPVPETSAVAAKMAKLAIQYSGYNSAMKRYALKNNDAPPDDLIDKHILSRGDDDFRYPRQRRDDHVRFRKDMVSYDTVYKGGGYVGISNPRSF